MSHSIVDGGRSNNGDRTSIDRIHDLHVDNERALLQGENIG